MHPTIREKSLISPALRRHRTARHIRFASDRFDPAKRHDCCRVRGDDPDETCRATSVCRRPPGLYREVDLIELSRGDRFCQVVEETAGEIYAAVRTEISRDIAEAAEYITRFTASRILGAC